MVYYIDIMKRLLIIHLSATQPLNMGKEMKDVNEFFDGISEIESKNHGGCLFFCYLFFLWLKKNNMPLKDFDIIQYHDFYDNIEHNLNWLYDKEGDPVSSYHFTWIYDGLEYDSDGEADDYSFIRYRECLELRDEEEIELFCANALKFGDWNPMFDRNEAIENVHHKFGIDLSEFEKDDYYSVFI